MCKLIIGFFPSLNNLFVTFFFCDKSALIVLCNQIHSILSLFDRVAEKTGRPALEVFEEAMNNVMPVLEEKARRIGGATYQVPIEVRPDRRQTLGLRWLTMFSRKRGEKTMADRLANEIMDAANNTGASVKRKEDMHKMAEANKAFSHFRF